MRTESELSYNNLDTVKEELMTMVEKIKTEETQSNPEQVSFVEFCWIQFEDKEHEYLYL